MHLRGRSAQWRGKEHRLFERSAVHARAVFPGSTLTESKVEITVNLPIKTSLF